MEKTKELTEKVIIKDSWENIYEGTHYFKVAESGGNYYLVSIESAEFNEKTADEIISQIENCLSDLDERFTVIEIKD